jgi:hypothetical protein
VNEEAILSDLKERKIADCQLVEVSGTKSHLIKKESKRAIITASMSSNRANQILINIKDKVENPEEI